MADAGAAPGATDWRAKYERQVMRHKRTVNTLADAEAQAARLVDEVWRVANERDALVDEIARLTARVAALEAVTEAARAWWAAAQALVDHPTTRNGVQMLDTMSLIFGKADPDVQALTDATGAAVVRLRDALTALDAAGAGSGEGADGDRA